MLILGILGMYFDAAVVFVTNSRILADQLTLFESGWADFAPHTTASPLGFKKLSTPLTAAFKQSVTVMSVDLCLAYMRVA